MQRTYLAKASLISITILTIISLTACGTNMTRRERNMAIGAGIGAAAGAVVTGGSATGTAAGAAAGAAIGYGVTDTKKKKR